MLNHGANTSNMTSANVSKSSCVIHLNTPINFASERETPTNAYSIRCASLVKSDSNILTPKDC